MRVIAYAFESDVHCPGCTGDAVRSHRLHLDNQHPCAIPVKHTGMDEFGIPLNMADREDNLIHAVFSTDENVPVVCCDCGGEL